MPTPTEKKPCRVAFRNTRRRSIVPSCHGSRRSGGWGSEPRETVAPEERVRIRCASTTFSDMPAGVNE